jgi:hypothetical protein
MSEMPITDGTAAYFSSVEGGRIVIHKNRPCLVAQQSAMPLGLPELSL